MRKIIYITLILIFSISCSHAPFPTLEEIQKKSLEDNLASRTIIGSFGFSFDKVTYYFTYTNIQLKDYSCLHIVGYKNEALAYSFSPQKLKELNEIYKQDISITEKKRLTLVKIQNFEYEKPFCDKPKDHSATEVILMTALFAPFIIVATPGIVLLETLKYQRSKQMDTVRLGMTEQEIRSRIDREPIWNKTKHYDYLTFENDRERMTLYFENNKLNAFVRGF